MQSSRSKRRRLMVSYIPQRPELPAIFESLNDDTLTTVLEFVGDKSYRSFGGLNKHCREIYLATPGMTKETFLYGYAPLSVIKERYDRSCNSYLVRDALVKGVVFYNRRDVLEWALQEKHRDVLKSICDAAVTEERLDILDEVFNNIDGDEDVKRDLFQFLDGYAAIHGKLNALKWFETKGLIGNKETCAKHAANKGHLHILEWLKEEKDLQLFGGLYERAIDGGQFHVMKWLREQGCPWSGWTFKYASWKGDLDILQWLQDEGCPWPEGDDDDYYHVNEEDLEPEVIEWCRVNGYGDRIEFEFY